MWSESSDCVGAAEPAGQTEEKPLRWGQPEQPKKGTKYLTHFLHVIFQFYLVSYSFFSFLLVLEKFAKL